MSELSHNITALLYVLVPMLAIEWLFKSPKAKEKVPLYWHQLGILVVLRTLLLVISGMIFFKAYPQSPKKIWQSMPFVESVAIAFVLYTFLHYWSHRIRHEVAIAWRVLHQMHHSPRRFDISTHLWAHPIESLFTNLFLFSFISLFGFDISYLLVISTAGRILNQSQHLNIQTPYWLGFVLQRPEQHRLHHAPNAYCNYGLIPLWDIIFGTFKNTREEVDLGFSEEAQTKFAEMLSFKKIS